MHSLLSPSTLVGLVDAPSLPPLYTRATLNLRSVRSLLREGPGERLRLAFFIVVLFEEGRPSEVKAGDSQCVWPVCRTSRPQTQTTRGPPNRRCLCIDCLGNKSFLLRPFLAWPDSPCQPVFFFPHHQLILLARPPNHHRRHRRRVASLEHCPPSRVNLPIDDA